MCEKQIRDCKCGWSRHNLKPTLIQKLPNLFRILYQFLCQTVELSNYMHFPVTFRPPKMHQSTYYLRSPKVIILCQKLL